MAIDEIIEFAFKNGKGSLAKFPREIAAMQSTPRQRFFKKQNDSLSSWKREGLVQEDPRTIRHYLEQLHLDKKERLILEIGTGSGWLTALMLELGAEVTSYEIDERTYEQARENLKPYINNSLTLIQGNGLNAPKNKYDRIIISGALPNTVEERKYLLSSVQEQLSAEGIFVGVQHNDHLETVEPMYSCVIGNKRTGTLTLDGPKMCPVPYIIGPRNNSFSDEEKRQYAKQLTQGIDTLAF